mgnify:FL=1
MNNEADMKELVISLSLRNQQLERDLAQEKIRSANLRAESESVMEEIKGYLKKEYIARVVLDSFNHGIVPLPSHLWGNRDLPVEVLCQDEDVKFHPGIGGFLITVAFLVAGDRLFKVDFRMSLSYVPGSGENVYPNFTQCSWDGPKPPEQKPVKKK